MICYLALFATVLVFASVGCRRANAKRDPIKLEKEKDLVNTPDDEELVKKLTVRRKLKLDVATLPAPGGGAWKFPDDAFLAHVDVEWAEATEGDEKAKEAHKQLLESAKKSFEQQKEALESKARQSEFNEIGTAYFDFVGRTPVNKRSVENFSQDLRRKKKGRLQKLVVNKTIEIVTDADLEAKGHIVAYHATAEKDGHMVMDTGKAVSLLKKEAINDLMGKQQLWVAMRGFAGFMAKTPADQRNQVRLKEYLAENAVPSLVTAIEANDIMMANPALPAPTWVAIQGKSEGPQKGHFGISAAAAYGFIPEASVQGNFVKDPGKK
jgi:methionine-rich copper-binding protein CopC